MSMRLLVLRAVHLQTGELTELAWCRCLNDLTCRYFMSLYIALVRKSPHYMCFHISTIDRDEFHTTADYRYYFLDGPCPVFVLAISNDIRTVFLSRFKLPPGVKLLDDDETFRMCWKGDQGNLPSDRRHNSSAL